MLIFVIKVFVLKLYSCSKSQYSSHPRHSFPYFTYPIIKIDDQGITTSLVGKEILFEFSKPIHTKNLNLSNLNLLSQVNNNDRKANHLGHV